MGKGGGQTVGGGPLAQGPQPSPIQFGGSTGNQQVAVRPKRVRLLPPSRSQAQLAQFSPPTHLPILSSDVPNVAIDAPSPGGMPERPFASRLLDALDGKTKGGGPSLASQGMDHANQAMAAAARGEPYAPSSLQTTVGGVDLKKLRKLFADLKERNFQ